MADCGLSAFLKKSEMKLLLATQVLLPLLVVTKACTDIRVTAEDNSVIVGRSMEFGIDPSSNVIVEPKGHSHIAFLPEICAGQDPMTWTNQHGSVAYLDAWNLPIGSDGQNEAGLSVGSLLFPGFAKFQDPERQKCGSSLSSLEFPRWILGVFKTVQDVREALRSDTFPLVWQQGSLELHYSVTDKTGDGIVIEFTDQGRKVHDNSIGIMTNSPPYDFHMLNLRNYIQLSKFAHNPLVLGKVQFNATGQGSGLLGMPGDLTPPSRFVRAAAMVHFSDPVQTAEQAVNLAFHILNTVDIPRGVASSHENENQPDYTSWVVVKDLTNNALYFRNYEDLTIRVIHLNKVMPGELLKIKVENPIGGFVDVTDKLKPVNAHTEL